MPDAAPRPSGEALKLHSWSSGELLIHVDPQRDSAAFAAAVQTLPPGSAWPVHRLMSCDLWLVFLKGQARLTVEGRHSTVVPGAAAFVPRHAWRGLRNTGTGMLQVAWVCAPPGLEQFFRDVSRFSSAPEPAVLRELASRYGLELQPEGAAAPTLPEAPRPGRRRRHRGRGGRRTHTPQPSVPGAVVPAPTTASPAVVVTPAQSAAAAPSVPHSRGRRRRHRGRPRSSGESPRPTQVQAPQSGAATVLPSPSPKTQPSRPPRSSRPPFRRGRFKEVYMGGRWVRVSGEGPVISSDHGEVEKGSEE